MGCGVLQFVHLKTPDLSVGFCCPSQLGWFWGQYPRHIHSSPMECVG